MRHLLLATRYSLLATTFALCANAAPDPIQSIATFEVAPSGPVGAVHGATSTLSTTTTNATFSTNSAPATATPATPATAPATTTRPTTATIAPDDSKTNFVELPTYVVIGERILPPPESWRYSSLPGFEILSNAPDFTTRAFLKDFQQLQSAIAAVWPTLSIHKPGTPTLLILCARDNSFKQFVPSSGTSDDFLITRTGLFVEDKERAAIVIDFSLQNALADMDNILDIVSQETFTASDDSLDPFSTSTPTGPISINQSINDPFRAFYRQYSRFLMRRANGNKPIPPWLEEGLAQLFNTLDFRKKWIEFGKVEHGFGENDNASASIYGDHITSADSAPMTASNIYYGNEPGSTSSRDRRARYGHIMPLSELFDPDSPGASTTQWRKQCFAFAHMCLYGANKKYQKPFLDFAKKALAGPVDEEDFKQCFKLNYKQMATRLASHVDSVSQQYVLFKTKRGMEGLPDPLPVELRDATQAEIGRIKGEVLRLAGHTDASREALITPYLRKERDPALLASLGLLESLENRADRARRFLEAAAKENVIRPRAYAELARLRLDEARAAPAGKNGKLSPAQTATVLDPLFKALTQPPPMEEVYTLIADAWLASEATPTEAHIAVLLEGTLFFPKNIALLEQAATLYTHYGDKTTAATLITLGTQLSPDPQTRQKFTTLRTRLK